MAWLHVRCTSGFLTYYQTLLNTNRFTTEYVLLTAYSLLAYLPYLTGVRCAGLTDRSNIVIKFPDGASADDRASLVAGYML